jgi:D-glycero-D-manno-heptose 1,7-bisphosphate phosphatase
MDAGRRELPGGWVSIRDGLIEAVGDGEPPACDERFDASGCVVCPGLVNAHQHLWYGLFKGLGEGLRLEQWLERLLFPLGALLEPADLVLATRLACVEMLSTGTTCAFEHSVTRTTPETALAVAAAARESGFRLVVVTNQPDIARGIQSREIVDAFHARLAALLPIDEFRLCPHDDGDRCACRKPLPGMLIAAAREAGVDLSRSYMVGDRWRDVEAGRRAGCTTIFIDRDYSETRPVTPDLVVRSLSEAADWILSRRTPEPT